MQFKTSFVLAVLSAAASVTANPLEVEKRAQACRITGDGARCRRSPNTGSDIIGQFGLGATPTFTCVSTGETVSGNSNWDRTTINGVACFVSDSLVALPCPGGLTGC
ncbi:Pc22g16310 protein [Mycena kentingensis (nom. inval.)]|nr:Pc22g16310 protein [Mycena kentingensis (nom. inval.)]